MRLFAMLVLAALLVPAPTALAADKPWPSGENEVLKGICIAISSTLSCTISSRGCVGELPEL